jgi:predicted HicB family RNase H-like nuclease
VRRSTEVPFWPRWRFSARGPGWPACPQGARKRNRLAQTSKATDERKIRHGEPNRTVMVRNRRALFLGPTRVVARTDFHTQNITHKSRYVRASARRDWRRFNRGFDLKSFTKFYFGYCAINFAAVEGGHSVNSGQVIQESIGDYLAFCKQQGEEPNKPFSGQFVTRIPPELHREVNLAASISGKSLNVWVAEQLQAAVASIKSMKAAKATRKGRRKSQRTEKHS